MCTSVPQAGVVGVVAILSLASYFYAGSKRSSIIRRLRKEHDAEFKKAVEDGGYDECFLCHAGSAASTDQLSIDLEAPVSTLTSAL